jgi:glycosyltransferase involved in cell wall biosynthesis
MATEENDGYCNANLGPFISVITVVFNGDKYLERTINSVTNQRYKNFEYIIIDGGSTDDTLNIIKKYEKNIKILVSEPDEGIYDAMNKGIALASGDIIGIINADDYYEPCAFGEVASRFKRDVIIYGDMVTHFDSGCTFTHKIPLPISKENLQQSAVHPTVFVAADLYKKYGVFNTKYRIASDYDLLIRMFRANAIFIKIDGVLTNFQEGGVSANGAGAKEGLLIALSHDFSRKGVNKKRIKIIFTVVKNIVKSKAPWIVNIKRKYL